MFKKVGKKWRYLLGALTLVAAALLLPDLATAGADTTMGDVVTQLENWCTGSMGKVVALGMMLVGLIGGIARQSLMSFAVGIGGGLGLANAPTIVGNVLTATLAAGLM
jgi:conjugal transfer pilus assembly protein TraA